jgi:holo-[acyl-carrier protein] synthase
MHLSLPSIGVDLVSVSRIARLHTRFGQRFLDRAFHFKEVAIATSLPPPRAATYLAARWAAKEALHKTLGSTHRLLFPEIEVANIPTSGAPTFILHGAARAWASREGFTATVSLSHEDAYAIAFVIAAREKEKRS